MDIFERFFPSSKAETPKKLEVKKEADEATINYGSIGLRLSTGLADKLEFSTKIDRKKYGYILCHRYAGFILGQLSEQDLLRRETEHSLNWYGDLLPEEGDIAKYNSSETSELNQKLQPLIMAPETKGKQILLRGYTGANLQHSAIVLGINRNAPNEVIVTQYGLGEIIENLDALHHDYGPLAWRVTLVNSKNLSI